MAKEIELPVPDGHGLVSGSAVCKCGVLLFECEDVRRWVRTKIGLAQVPELVKALWDVYIEGCLCNMDHHSSCRCPATDIASDVLRSLFGDDWHDKLREVYASE